MPVSEPKMFPIHPGKSGYIAPAEANEPVCQAFSFYACTRPEGHTGDHVAHGINDRMLGQWPQE